MAKHRSGCKYMSSKYVENWHTFWSYVAADGTEYRHQVRQSRPRAVIGGVLTRLPLDQGEQWLVRTQIRENGGDHYYSARIPVPKPAGKELYRMRTAWVPGGHSTTMYPPQYAAGFMNLEEGKEDDAV